MTAVENTSVSISNFLGEVEAAKKSLGILANAAGNADQLGHGGVAARADGGTVLAKGGGDGVLAAVLVLNLELMLQEL